MAWVLPDSSGGENSDLSVAQKVNGACFRFFGGIVARTWTIIPGLVCAYYL